MTTHITAASSNVTISISSAFDGGNIKHIKTTNTNHENSNNITVELAIKPDPYTELEQKHHFQYFSFRSTAAASFPPSSSSPRQPSTLITYTITNAGEASYPIAWKGSTTVASINNGPWRRIPNTHYDDTKGHLTWTHRHYSPTETVHFAYFPPYSYDRHLNLISQCHASSPSATVSILGQSLDGRDVECITVGSGDRIAWVIHRQHPGETMAEFFAEGLLSRLLGFGTDGAVDGLSRRALSLYTFHVVPNMCPDGSVRGHLRTNAAGANLNREWCPSRRDEDGTTVTTYYEAPTLRRSPEVYHVLRAMDATGVDAFLDVHGDEELPYNFLSGSEGCPNWGPRLRALHGAFLGAYVRANGDMQKTYGYEVDPPNGGKLNICSNQIAARFDCFSATLEMPFKDCESGRDEERGWSTGRAMMLGGSCLDALVYVHPYLRVEGDFWEDLKEDDKYVCPLYEG